MLPKAFSFMHRYIFYLVSCFTYTYIYIYMCVCVCVCVCDAVSYTDESENFCVQGGEKPSYFVMTGQQEGKRNSTLCAVSRLH